MSTPASSQDLIRLKAVLDGALAGLEGIENKTLFGCDACFVGGNIFALVWTDGRLGLRMSDAESHERLLAEDGAGPWMVDGKAVKHWVLLPVSWAAQPAQLRRWGRQAYELAKARPEKRSVTGRKGAGAKSIKAAVFKKAKRPSRG